MKACWYSVGLIGLLVSCQSDQRQTAVEKARPALAAPSPVSLVDSAKPATSTPTRQRREEIISVDGTGPMKVATDFASATQIRLKSYRPDTLFNSYEIYRIDTLFGGRFLAAYDDEHQPTLYYRSSQQDTLWQVFYLPTNEYKSGEDAVELTLDTANLDKQGQAEVLVQLSSASNGSGGGTSYQSFFLLDVTPPEPKLLLRGQSAILHEWFPGYFAIHNLELAPEDQTNGYERTITLRNNEIAIGRIRK